MRFALLGAGALARTTAPCSRFGTTIALASGWYTARVTLVDADGQDVATDVDAPEFWVMHDGDTLVDTDFPADAFFD